MSTCRCSGLLTVRLGPALTLILCSPPSAAWPPPRAPKPCDVHFHRTHRRTEQWGGRLSGVIWVPWLVGGRTELGTQVARLPGQGFLQGTSPPTLTALPALPAPFGPSLSGHAEHPDQRKQMSPGKGQLARSSRDGTATSSPSEASLLSHFAISMMIKGVGSNPAAWSWANDLNCLCLSFHTMKQKR